MTGLPSQFQLLSSAIEFANQNHRVISQNLANVNTPNYQARQLSFEKFLDRIEKGSNQTTGSAADQFVDHQYELEYTSGAEIRSDGNNVDLDTQLASMKKNDLAHQTLTQLLGAKLAIMKTAIKG